MAKVKTAKDQITAYMKAKGWDISEIKDKFDELDAADADLGQLADALAKNEQWTTWYQTAAPEIQKIASERDTLKGKIEKLQAAGFSVDEAKAVAQGSPATQGQPGDTKYVTQESLDQFRNQLASASSDVMKDLIKINFKHFKEFNTEADLDAIETLMKPDPQTGQRKAFTVSEAYRMWSEPEYEKKRTADTDRKIADGIKKGVQDELSKAGYSRPRKSKEQIQVGIENAPLDKPAPSEHELRTAFLADLTDEVTH